MKSDDGISSPPQFEKVSFMMDSSVTSRKTKKLLPRLQMILLVVLGMPDGDVTLVMLACPISVKLEAFEMYNLPHSPLRICSPGRNSIIVFEVRYFCQL